ncbi:MAG: hypothetical protein NVV59_03095 [Chitinophagaceae bacterium]|nr:hypothetical protein [Chitinophagaceae bacterium]
MRIASLRWLPILAVTLFVSCSKGSGGSGGNPPPPPDEANLVVTTDPANNAVVPAAPGPYSVKVTITSAMPKNGVTLEVKARKDDGSGAPAFFTYSNNTTNAVSNINITSVPANTLCLVEVKVTSLTKASNTWSGSYRFSAK